MDPRRLVLCPRCGRDFVVAVDGTEFDDERWAVALRCGACGEFRSVLVSNEEVDLLCDEIDVVLGRLAVGVERLRRERIEAEIDAFAAALELDLITSDDFAC